jgi:hypothetical protein
LNAFAEGEDEPAESSDTGEAGDEDDVALPAAATETLETQTNRPPQVVFVNFRGPTIRNCGNYCSDASTNRSWVVGNFFGRGSFDFAPYTNAANKPVIVRKLRAIFARYRVSFTTTRPASGAFTMIVISPSYAAHHGVAPLDCGNANQSDIAFVYRIGNASADIIARFAAHELGHSFGLSHVVSGADIMHWDSSGRSFSASTYDAARDTGKCYPGSLQKGPALLAASLGLR